MLPEDSKPKSGLLSWHPLVLAIAGAVALYARFFRAHTFGFFEDDFFYYAQVARNLVAHGTSSFDGVHLTNGYHPLWLLTLTALYAAFQGTAFLVAVQTASLALLLAFYVATLRTLERLGVPGIESKTWEGAPLRLAALLLSLHVLLLFRYGMEVSAALPLGLAAIAYSLGPRFRWTNLQTLGYGLLACLTVLARLDCALLIALLFFTRMLASRAPWLTRIRRSILFSAAFVPFFAYLAVNVRVFHSLLPVSGHAKQLKPLLPASLMPVSSMVWPPDRMKIAFVFPALLLLGLGIAQLIRRWSSLPRRHRPVYLSLFAFPFVHLATLSLLSDWPVWPWYFYSLTFSSVAAISLLVRPGTRRVWVPILATASTFYLAYLAVYSVHKQPSTIALLAEDVALYARQHPGNYAMGDEAGTAAWLSQQPIVQLEGLMMDADYVQVIAARTPLAQVFARYHTQYYVLLGIEPGADGCTHSFEPTQGGPHSPHMLGTTCAAPVAHFSRGGISMNIFDATTIH